jgi:hypothetical protein
MVEQQALCDGIYPGILQCNSRERNSPSERKEVPRGRLALSFCLSKHFILQGKPERQTLLFIISSPPGPARPLIPRFNNRRPRLSSSRASPNHSLNPDLLGPAICASRCFTIRAWVHVDFNSRLPTSTLFGRLLGVDLDSWGWS